MCVLPYIIIKITKAKIINNNIILMIIEIIKLLNINLFINITSLSYVNGDDNHTSEAFLTI